MIATTAVDTDGVEYYFEETTGNPGGSDSGWQEGPVYTDTGLSADTQYCYRVRARDKSANQNPTEWSDAACARTDVDPATVPPQPNPMAWQVVPRASDPHSIGMTAAVATDPDGVEYLFEETTGNPGGSDSDWQDSPVYSDGGLSPNTLYCYRVRARDKSPNRNPTEWSASAWTATGPVLAGDAPAQNWVGFLRVDESPYAGWPRLEDVVLDVEGNAYAVGQIDWQDPALGWAGVVWVAKWSRSGELLWNKTYDQPVVQLHPRAAAMDDSGNLFIVGIRSSGTPPTWFILRINSSGTLQDVWTANDGTYKCFRTIDIHPNGDLLVCANYGSYDAWVGRFSWESGSWTWKHVYDINPATHHDFAIGAVGALDTENDVYYFGKNVDLGTSVETIILKASAGDGSIQGFASFDFAAGAEEMPSALGVDNEGNLLGLVWHVADQCGTVFKLDSGLNPVWTHLVQGEQTYLFLRDLDIGADGTIYVVGREGEDDDWDQPSENSHMFTCALDADGELLWIDPYDPGGSAEKEWGDGNGIAVAPGGGRVVAGGDLAYSETDWVRSLALLSYGKTLVDTPAVFRVEAQTGDLHSDGMVHAGSFAAGSADVAEWVPVAATVGPGDVLELDLAQPGTYRLSANRCSHLVAGVVSTQPGVVLADGIGMCEKTLLALTGIVPVKVTREGGPIQPGDLLVTSSTPGHAMRWSGSDPCLCSLVGKALEPMLGESGIILVLLTAH